MAAKLLFLACAVLAGSDPDRQGILAGVVRNATRGGSPAAHSRVVLRVRMDGQVVPFDQTTADAHGKFVFQRLPVGRDYPFLPGANCDGVHYPGPAVRLTAGQPRAAVELVVYDAIAEPSPLVIRRHEIVLCPEPGAIRVTESILIDNPSSTCYVGQTPKQPDEEPVTLHLAVPSNFQRTTFHEEFFGRRFRLSDGKLITGIPWPPGKRELAFTYVLPSPQRHFVWQRPVDLPCDQLRVRVQSERPDEVTCTLPRAAGAQHDELVFESAGQGLAAGDAIRVELGRLSVPWMAYARWLALAVLSTLIAGVSLLIVRQRAPFRRSRSSARHSCRVPGNG